MPKSPAPVALITGASSGIGEATAIEFAKNGWSVVLFARRENELEAVAKKCREAGAPETLTVVGSVASMADCDRAAAETLEKFGRIDLLANIAGIAQSEKVDGDDFEKAWEVVIDTNLTGTMRATRAVLPTMKAAKSGKIINISSIHAFAGRASSTPYEASKAGIDGFTRGCAVEFAPHNIQVNSIAPGIILTEFIKENIPRERLQKYYERLPAGDFGEPSDVAKLAFFLAEAPVYLTGQTIRIDGGSGINLINGR